MDWSFVHDRFSHICWLPSPVGSRAWAPPTWPLLSGSQPEYQDCEACVEAEISLWSRGQKKKGTSLWIPTWLKIFTIMEVNSSMKYITKIEPFQIFLCENVTFFKSKCLLIFTKSVDQASPQFKATLFLKWPLSKTFKVVNTDVVQLN